MFNSFFILLLYLTKRSFLAAQMYLSAKDWMEWLKCTHTFKSKFLFPGLHWLPWLHRKHRHEKPGMRLIYSQLLCMVAFIWCCSSFTKLNNNNTVMCPTMCYCSWDVSFDHCTDFMMSYHCVLHFLALFTIKLEHTYKFFMLLIPRKEAAQTKSLCNGRNIHEIPQVFTTVSLIN